MSTGPVEPTVLNREISDLPQTISWPPQTVRKPRLWLHLLLFALTLASTTLVAGPKFSAGLLSILLLHEFGHYFVARSYKVPVSLPYFIPFPFSLFGTLGAFIRMSPRIPSRRALFDIAAAGPLAGLIAAIPLSYVGVAFSQVIPKNAIPENAISLGEPLLFQGLTYLVHGKLGANFDLMLHPLAFAGWAGMFVTALNLLPIGQLDGGHISHALFGSRSPLVAWGIFGALATYCLIQQNFTWLPLLLLLLFFGVRHPPSLDDGLPLGGSRKGLGMLLAAVLLLCFSLAPIKF